MKGSVRKKAQPKGDKPGAPPRRVDYRSSAMADETRQMESELRYIQKAKIKEKEEDATRQRFAGGATWSRSGSNTSIRKYDKEFMSAVSTRPRSGSSGGGRPVSRERQVLDCSTNQSGPTKQTRGDGCVASAGLAAPAGSRRPAGLFDMPTLPKPPTKQDILSNKAPPAMPEPTKAPSPPPQPKPSTEAAQAQASLRAAALASELEEENTDFAVQREPPKPESPAPEPTVFSNGFQALLEQELGGWTNPADNPQGAGWVNPGDETAIDAELAAAEARVQELRRLKSLKSGQPAPAPAPAVSGGWSNPADNAPGNGSLWGTFDEAAQQSAFADAVNDWRGGGTKASTTGAGNSSAGGALWGSFDEEAQKNSFQEAVKGWRGEAVVTEPVGSTQAESTSVGAAAPSKSSCYQCYKLFWSDKTFRVPEAERTGDVAMTAGQPFCSEPCWLKAETSAKISDAKKAARARANSSGKA